MKRHGPPPPHGPLERLLGLDGTDLNAHAVLGLSEVSASNEQVRAAFEARIRQLESHPEASTPAGEEVRLALHVAAAQLLDPTAPRQNAQPGIAASVGAAVGRPRSDPAQASVAQAVLREVESEALIAIALHGGWNRRALRHLVIVAHQRGLTSSQIAAGLRWMSRGTERAGATRPVSKGEAPSSGGRHSAVPAVPASAAPADTDADPLVRVILIVGGMLAAIVVVIAGVVIAASTNGGGAGGGTAASAGATSTTAPAAGAPRAAGPTQRGEQDEPRTFRMPTLTDDKPARNPADARVAARMLADATAGLEIDTAAASGAFADAYQAIAENWCDFAPDQVRAMQSAIVEYVYRAAAAGAGESALSAMTRPLSVLTSTTRDSIDGDDVWPAVWSAGMLTRLRRERDLSAQLKREIASAISPIGEPTTTSFEAGGLLALDRLARRLVEQPSASATPMRQIRDRWECWVSAASAVGRNDRGAFEAVLLSVADSIVTRTGSAAMSPDARAAVFALVPQLNWREDGAARRWLLGMLSNPAVSTHTLAAVTEALAVGSSAGGVDVTMVLSPTASDLARRDLRDRYAEAWSMPDAGTTAATALRLSGARAALLAEAAPRDALGRLTLAVRLARLSAAATLLWDGRTADAETILDDDFKVVDAALAAGRSGGGSLGGQPGRWAEDYLTSRADPERRLELLRRVPTGTQMSPVDAEVLVEVAIRGTPKAAREAAEEAVLARSDRAAIVNAVLEELPRAPRIRRVARLIEFCSLASLPDVRDPDWEREARKALVERLLELLATDGPYAPFDRLAEVLAASYDEAIGASVSGAALDLPGAAKYLASRWRSSADAVTIPSLSPEAIEQRRTARSAVARGVIQRFLVEQIAMAESLAAAVATEQPEQRSLVLEVLDAMERERRVSADAFAQVAVTELAITRLWLIRYRIDGGKG